MNPPRFNVGDEVEMTNEALKLRLHRHEGLRGNHDHGKVVGLSLGTGLVTVCIKGQNRIYSERFLKKRDCQSHQSGVGE